MTSGVSDLLPSRLWKCACGGCNPDRVNLRLHNCAMCGYLAHSEPSDPVEVDGHPGTELHRCPVCGDSYWLYHEVWSRQNGYWVERSAS